MSWVCVVRSSQEGVCVFNLSFRLTLHPIPSLPLSRVIFKVLLYNRSARTSPSPRLSAKRESRAEKLSKSGSFKSEFIPIRPHVNKPDFTTEINMFSVSRANSFTSTVSDFCVGLLLNEWFIMHLIVR